MPTARYGIIDTKPMRAEHILILFLRVSAAILLLALPAALMPQSWMAAIHHALGLGTLSEQTIVAYLTRSVSALYACLGALYAFVSFDVRRYLPLLRFSAWLKLTFGLGMLALDVAVGMPAPWTAVEGPFIVTWSLALLGLVRAAHARV
jgi:hypothetical protein